MDAFCGGVSSIPEKMKRVPIRTPLIAPMGLKACEKFSRRSALAAGPSCVMKGFAAISRKARPLATMKSALRKKA
jgi:hypothetical protein